MRRAARGGATRTLKTEPLRGSRSDVQCSRLASTAAAVTPPPRRPQHRLERCREALPGAVVCRNDDPEHLACNPVFPRVVDIYWWYPLLNGLHLLIGLRRFASAQHLLQPLLICLSFVNCLSFVTRIFTTGC